MADQLVRKWIDGDKRCRHNKIKPLPKNPFTDKLIDELALGLNRVGYKHLMAQDFQTAVCSNGLWLPSKPLNLLGPDEHLFSRNCGSATRFFVFVKKTEDSVVVFFYNPMERPGAAIIPTDAVYRRNGYSMGNPTDIAKRVIEEIGIFASFKKDGRFRGQIHNHMGYSAVLYPGRNALDYPRLYDDGETYFLDFIRAAMLHHIDVLTWTPHNWVRGANERTYELMKAICEIVGMAMPKGVEISAPLKKDKASGPHMLVIGTDNALTIVQREILDRRDPNVIIGSCFKGMVLDDMLKILEPLRKSNQIIIGFPHPWNDSSINLGVGRMMRLESTGILSAVDTGQITLDHAIELLGAADFIGAFNPTLTNCGLDISNTALKLLVNDMIRGHVPGAKPSANAVNLALPQRLGNNSTYDPDDHRTLPLSSWARDYDGTGFKWGGGHTAILWETQRTPDAEGFIRAVKTGAAKLEAVIFQKLSGAIPKLVRVRTQKNNAHSEMDDKMSKRQNEGYVGDFLATVGKIGTDAFDIISE